MKQSMTFSVACATILSLLGFAGCSSKEPKMPEPSALIKKHKDLPTWVNEDNGEFSAVGSARYKGQTYMQQKSEAELVASSELALKIEKRVDALMKSYHRTTGQAQALTEDVYKSTLQQISSQTLNGVTTKNVYISDDGEMFVKIELNPDFLVHVLKSDYAKNRQAWQQINAESAFSELNTEIKNYRQERAAQPKPNAETNVTASN